MKKTLWIILAAFTLTCLGTATSQAATHSGKATTQLASKKHAKKHSKKKHKKHTRAAHHAPATA
jgi:hypothetical protein